MTRVFACIFIIMFIFFCPSRGCAWTDDVEGMLMPSPRGEDTMSDPQSILENIEGSTDVNSEDTGSMIERN